MATTSTPVDFVLPPWDFSEDLVAKAIQRHLESKRRGGSRVTNPYTEGNYQIRPPFHITFYEKLTDVNIFLNGKKHSFMATNKENRRIGTLYERQDTGSTASRAHSTSDDTKQDLNARAFRHSAVTACLLSFYVPALFLLIPVADSYGTETDGSRGMYNLILWSFMK